MGAEFWEHLTVYQPDAEAALRCVQAEVFENSGCDLAKLFQERIADMADAVKACEDDDPYGLLENYQDALQQLRRLAASGVPEQPDARIKLLREIEAISSASAPGILALEGLSPKQREWKVQLLTSKQIKEVFGTAKPSMSDLRKGVYQLAETMDRGMAVAFPVFENSRPALWCFVGYTAD